MKLYRFSPIRSKEVLFETLEYVHVSCFELCKKALGKYLPVAGNIGIFCHYDEEFEFLTKSREELTDKSDNFNNKYYRLYEPITFAAKGDIPETTYTYLYIRRPDQYRAQVGDVDFVIEKKEYEKLKSLSGMDKVKLKRFLRPDLDMVELSDPDIDTLAYLGTKNIAEKIETKAG